MTLNQLAYFCMLAQTESYTRAAQRLYISQPSLSYAIANLEKELGCALLCKQGRGVALTEAGRTFYRYAEAALAALDQGVKAVRTSGVIRIGAICTAMADRLPQLLVRFKAENPQLTLDVATDTTHGILQKVESGALDVGVCSLDARFGGVRFAPLYAEPWTLVTPADHPLVKLGRPVTLREIAQYPLLCYKPFSPIHALVLQAFAAVGAAPQIAYELDDETAIGGMVQSGAGISLCLDTDLLRPFPLARVPLADSMPRRLVYAAYRAAEPPPEPLQRFLDFLAAHAEP